MASQTPAAAISVPGLLKPGQFYSSTAERREQRRDYAMAELVQTQARHLPVHSHELNYFFFLLDGNFMESDWRGTREFGAMSGGFNPSDTPHDGRVGPHGAKFFTVELLPEFVEHSGVRLPTEPIVDHGGRELVWAGLRMLREFRNGAAADRLSCDSLVCEMLADAAGYHQAERDRAPVWLRRTCELLDDLRCVEAGELSISSLAAEAGVHPVHLARAFRRRMGMTPGEYRQRARVRVACDRLLNSQMPLVEVAAVAGFSDQSHMSRVFRKRLGTAPGEWRKALCRFPAQ